MSRTDQIKALREIERECRRTLSLKTASPGNQGAIAYYMAERLFELLGTLAKAVREQMDDKGDR